MIGLDRMVAVYGKRGLILWQTSSEQEEFFVPNDRQHNLYISLHLASKVMVIPGYFISMEVQATHLLAVER